MKTMNVSHLLKDATINVSFSKKLKIFDGYFIACKKKMYWIMIKNNINYRDTLHVLAHELVHFKQFAGNEITRYDLVKGKVTFNKVIYDTKKLHYYDYPWEIEAHGREHGLVERYIDYANALKKNKGDVKKQRRKFVNTEAR